MSGFSFENITTDEDRANDRIRFKVKVDFPMMDEEKHHFMHRPLDPTPAYEWEDHDSNPEQEKRNVWGGTASVHYHFSSEPPVLAIWGGDPARVMLTIRVEDGKLVTDYDPADLDESTREFLREVQETHKEMNGE